MEETTFETPTVSDIDVPANLPTIDLPNIDTTVEDSDEITPEGNTDTVDLPSGEEVPDIPLDDIPVNEETIPNLDDDAKAGFPDVEGILPESLPEDEIEDQLSVDDLLPQDQSGDDLIVSDLLPGNNPDLLAVIDFIPTPELIRNEAIPPGNVVDAIDQAIDDVLFIDGTIAAILPNIDVSVPEFIDAFEPEDFDAEAVISQVGETSTYGEIITAALPGSIPVTDALGELLPETTPDGGNIYETEFIDEDDTTDLSQLIRKLIPNDVTEVNTREALDALGLTSDNTSGKPDVDPKPGGNSDPSSLPKDDILAVRKTLDISSGSPNKGEIEQLLSGAGIDIADLVARSEGPTEESLERLADDNGNFIEEASLSDIIKSVAPGQLSLNELVGDVLATETNSKESIKAELPSDTKIDISQLALQLVDNPEEKVDSTETIQSLGVKPVDEKEAASTFGNKQVSGESRSLFERLVNVGPDNATFEGARPLSRPDGRNNFESFPEGQVRTGTPGNDSIIGSKFSDKFTTGRGIDTIQSRNGTLDVILPGDGADNVFVNDGAVKGANNVVIDSDGNIVERPIESSDINDPVPAIPAPRFAPSDFRGNIDYVDLVDLNRSDSDSPESNRDTVSFVKDNLLSGGFGLVPDSYELAVIDNFIVGEDLLRLPGDLSNYDLQTFTTRDGVKNTLISAGVNLPVDVTIPLKGVVDISPATPIGLGRVDIGIVRGVDLEAQQTNPDVVTSY